MRSTDTLKVQSLFKEIDRVHQQLLPHEFSPYEGEPRSDHFITTLLNDRTRRVFIAEYDHHIVGMTIGQIIDQPQFKIFRPFRYVLVTDFVVLPDYRQKGIGNELMKHIETWAKNNKADNIRLSVYSQNQNALDYYTKHGFQPLKQTLQKPL